MLFVVMLHGGYVVVLILVILILMVKINRDGACYADHDGWMKLICDLQQITDLPQTCSFSSC